ncbi:hypothetical protein [Psychromonas aquimarina]|uniref:hypothetical protein n=1 Tax=Psychromonas aquimarina TaxID=444919 RepID=UPI000420B6FE|nr:hypothetical protein [Psychromonas aquimarina]
MSVFSYTEPINLNKAVVMKGEPLSHSEYIETLQGEQNGALQYLDSPDIVWNVPDSLKCKVKNNGELTSFYGDTTVFKLSEDDIDLISGVMESLAPIQETLAEPLDREQLHLTLHDLSNSPVESQISDQLMVNETKVKEVLKRVRSYLNEHPDQRKIKMLSTNAYPCLNTSILLGFAPKSEQDLKRLINLYNLFDDVVYLNYWLRPHITLSYFEPRVLKRSEIIKLSDTLKDINGNVFELELDMLELAYQHFSSMNSYKTIITLKDLSRLLSK